MLGKTLASPVLTFDSSLRLFSYPDSCSVATKNLLHNVSLGIDVCSYTLKGHQTKWELHSTTLIQGIVLSDEEKQTWDSCKQALAAFGCSVEEQDKMLGKAFGHIHSPYWGEERKKEVPKYEVVNEILDYLQGLGLSKDDLGKLLKKFPEVLGCSLEDELKINVQVLEKEWGIKGKSLRSLLLRNPKALGYNIDCKGDCVAQCTRCWARF